MVAKVALEDRGKFLVKVKIEEKLKKRCKEDEYTVVHLEKKKVESETILVHAASYQHLFCNDGQPASGPLRCCLMVPCDWEVPPGTVAGVCAGCIDTYLRYIFNAITVLFVLSRPLKL